MKVIVLTHENSGHKIFHEGSDVTGAMRTLGLCLRRQRRKPKDEREAVTVSYDEMSKAEWDAMEDTPPNAC
jgi:hypothetical protein